MMRTMILMILMMRTMIKTLFKIYLKCLRCKKITINYIFLLEYIIFFFLPLMNNKSVDTIIVLFFDISS
jgi:hypothetical protein